MSPHIIQWKKQSHDNGPQGLISDCPSPLTSLIMSFNTFPLLFTHQPSWPLLRTSNMLIMLLSQDFNINWPSDVHMSYSLISFRALLEWYLPKRAPLTPSTLPAHFFSTFHSPSNRTLSLFIGLPYYNVNLGRSKICVPFSSLGYAWHRAGDHRVWGRGDRPGGHFWFGEEVYILMTEHLLSSIVLFSHARNCQKSRFLWCIS